MEREEGNINNLLEDGIINIEYDTKILLLW